MISQRILNNISIILVAEGLGNWNIAESSAIPSSSKVGAPTTPGTASTITKSSAFDVKVVFTSTILVSILFLVLIWIKLLLIDDDLILRLSFFFPLNLIGVIIFDIYIYKKDIKRILRR